MHVRYCRDLHPHQVITQNNSTSNWKRMLQIKDEAEKYIQWIVGRGKIGISLDKWIDIDTSVLANKMSVRSIFSSRMLLNEEMATLVLGHDTCLRIKQANKSIVENQDKIIWTKSTNGHFSIGSAWEHVRRRSFNLFIYKHI